MSEHQDRWRGRLDAPVEQVKAWVEPRDWVTKPYPKKMRDADGSVFEVPSLFLQRGPTRLLQDPIAHDAPGTEGIVDLDLIPTYDDTASLDVVKGRWQIHYDVPDAPTVARVNQAEVMDLSEATINRVLDEIAAQAVPSV